MMTSDFKELSEEEFNKLTDEEKKRYLINKFNGMNVVDIKQEDKKENKA